MKRLEIAFFAVRGTFRPSRFPRSLPVSPRLNTVRMPGHERMRGDMEKSGAGLSGQANAAGLRLALNAGHRRETGKDS